MTIKMKILLLDNYDSFTYNLLHAVKELGATDVEVVRNDQIELDEVDRFDKSNIFIFIVIVKWLFKYYLCFQFFNLTAKSIAFFSAPSLLFTSCSSYSS